MPDSDPRFWQPTPAEKLQAGQLILLHNRTIDKINDAIDVLYVRNTANDPNAERIEERLANAKKAVEASVYCITLEKAQPSKEGSDKVKVKALHCTKHINSYKSKDFLLPLPHSSNAWQEIGGFDPPLKVEDRTLELGKQSYVVCFEPFFLEFNANEEIEVS